MESRPAPVAGQCSPPSYNRACANCSRVKSKCVFKTNVDSCERCQRLQKACQPSLSVRKRNGRRTLDSRTAQLEGKLDEIVSLLRPPQKAEHSLSETSPSINHDGSIDHGLLFVTNHVNSASPANISGNTVIGPRSDPLTPSTTTQNSDVCSATSPISVEVAVYNIDSETAEEQLNTFRHRFLPYFPFVHIPDSMSELDLRLQKPFLWLVIMSLTTKSVEQQLAMGVTIRQIVSQKVVAENERDLDILQGLICFLAWFQYHKKEKPYLIMWTQLAVSLVFELGIYREAQIDVGQFSSRSGWFPPRLPKHTRTIEERRTILATFIVSSMAWTGLRQIEPMRWTLYMDDAVRILGKENETDLDFLLITQAKCYVMIYQLTRPSAEWTTELHETNAPPASFLKGMQAQLHNIQQSLPQEIQDKKAILLYIYGADVIIKEASLNRPKIKDHTGLSNLQRLETFESILTSIERWLELFFAVPILEWIGIPFSLFSQFSHCTVLLYKLTTLDAPGWDTNEVRRRLDLLDVLERLTQRQDDIPGAIGFVDAVNTGETNIFRRYSPLIRSSRASFLAEIGPNPFWTDAQAIEDNASVDDLSRYRNPDDIFGHFSSEPWLTDIFASSWTYDL